MWLTNSVDNRWLWLAAGVFIFLRLLANMFDGMVAFASNMSSPLGELFNELPDRIADTIIIVGFSLNQNGDYSLGLWAAIAAMFTAYVRATVKLALGKSVFAGPMAKQQRMFLIIGVCLLKTYDQTIFEQPWLPALAPLNLSQFVLWTIIVGSVITAVNRLSIGVRGKANAKG